MQEARSALSVDGTVSMVTHTFSRQTEKQWSTIEANRKHNCVRWENYLKVLDLREFMLILSQFGLIVLEVTQL